MATKKIATNIPEMLLKEAVRLSGLDQTKTLIEGLKSLISQKKRDKLLALKGRIHIQLNTDTSRARQKT